MRKFLITTGSLVVALALAFGAAPARAGEVGWADPEGDATGLSAVESTPRPSDASLDILKMSWTTNGTELVIVAHLKQAIGDPEGSTGRDFDFNFNHDGVPYSVGAQLPTPPLDTAFVSGPTMTADGETVDCSCKLRLDSKTNTLTLTVSYDGLDRAIPGNGKVGPGTQLTDLVAQAARIQGALLLDVDTSAPAEGTILTF